MTVRIATRKKSPPPIRLKIPFCFNFIRYSGPETIIAGRYSSFRWREIDMHPYPTSTMKCEIYRLVIDLVLPNSKNPPFASFIKVQPSDPGSRWNSKLKSGIEGKLLYRKTMARLIKLPHLLRNIYASERLPLVSMA